MTDWSCRECHGRGMVWSEERKAMVLCHCPKGEAKRNWLAMTPEQQQEARRRPARAKKRDEEQERIPF